MIMTVNDFNIQQSLIASAEEALDLAVMAYEQTRQRFIIGKADVNSLTLSLNRQQEDVYKRQGSFDNPGPYSG